MWLVSTYALKIIRHLSFLSYFNKINRPISFTLVTTQSIIIYSMTGITKKKTSTHGILSKIGNIIDALSNHIRKVKQNVCSLNIVQWFNLFIFLFCTCVICFHLMFLTICLWTPRFIYWTVSVSYNKNHTDSLNQPHNFHQISWLYSKSDRSQKHKDSRWLMVALKQNF